MRQARLRSGASPVRALAFPGLVAGILLAVEGCGGGKQAGDPPSNFKVAPMAGEHRRTNAAKGEEPGEGYPAIVGGEADMRQMMRKAGRLPPAASSNSDDRGSPIGSMGAAKAGGSGFGGGGFRGGAVGGASGEDDGSAPGLSRVANEGSITTQRITSGVTDDKSNGDNGKQPAKQPQVWHQEGHRPSFARVYIGGGNSLELVSLQVTVTIEGPRARTLVDHIFRNPHDRQLEGTFEYPLPTGASPSYYAMFLGQTRDTVPPRFLRRGDAPPLPQGALARLAPSEVVKQVNATDWGRLQEGRIVAKEKALETYEEIVRGRIDPALLEYAGGNTFSGRVFPIPAKGYNRVLVAYEELLPVIGEHEVYRYVLPDCKLTELQFTLLADSAECKEPVFQPADAQKGAGGNQLSFVRTWKDQGPGGAVQFTFKPLQPGLQAISGRQGETGPLYLYARIRPDLKVQAAKPFTDRAVFLLDTSQSEHPDRFAVSMKLLRKILETDPDIKQFNVLAFNIGACWVETKGWLANTPANRDKVFSRLDGCVLEGATDLSAALNKLADPGFDVGPGTPLNVFLLSDGQVTWGEPDVASLVGRFESRCPFPTHFYCYHVGIGAENDELYEALIRRGGGIFNCFSDADLAAAAQAHRTQCLQVDKITLSGAPTASDFLVAGRKAAVYPNGEILVAAQVNSTGRARLLLEGTFQGQKVLQEFPLEISSASDLAPRGWAEIAVASLLALNDPSLDSLTIAYCQQFGIASRLASFLVLENENEYKRLNLQQERGKAVSGGDLGQFIEQAWRQIGKAVGGKEAFTRLLSKFEPQLGLWSSASADRVRRLLAQLTDADFELPESTLTGAILEKKDVPPSYLSEREKDPRNVGTYLTEARRRSNGHDAPGAVRVLSSIVEEFPARSDALRLVGYRLIDLQQPAQAARLFQQVQRSRPFEPHSYRDLARSLEESGKFGLAALQYEILLGGAWHNRFRQSLKVVGEEEYARMMQEAVRRKDVSPALKSAFGERLEQMVSGIPQSDLRVTISWNTDATDVDLWVMEPDGTKCFYQQQHTPSGGELSQDQTQGYGPERYQIRQAQPGVYRILVHYFRANPNLLAGETHVAVTVTRHAGTPQETSERHTVILTQQDRAVEVCKVEF
jgi:von Willebrand factor type A domain